jgi:nucleotide-binding universal stress UspA family protein
MRTVLAAIDGSNCSDRAVEELMKRAKAGEKLQVHLLNVQPRIFPEEAMVFLDPAKMDTYYYEQGSRALASAEQRLKKAGLSFTAHRATGPVAETIVAKAKELGVDEILMGTHGRGRVGAMLLGSVATKVLHMATVPVMLVQTERPVDFSGRLQAT